MKVKSSMAELWALRDRLNLAKQLNIENICVEMDVEFLIYLLSNSSANNLILKPLLIDCRNLMKTFPNCTVARIYKETNKGADKLARMGADLQSDYPILCNPLPMVEELLASDKVKHICNKLVVL